MQPSHILRPEPEESEASQALAQLRIEKQVVLDSLRAGLDEGLRPNPNAPRIARGFYTWSGTVQALRTSLAAEGWLVSDGMNLPVVASPDGRVQFIVASGDAGTGVLGAIPTTSLRKGTATSRHVFANQTRSVQLSLELDVHANTAQRTDCRTWMLLYRHDVQNRVSTAELSLPVDLDEGRVSAWGARTIIEVPQLFPEEFKGQPDAPTLDDVDFEIRAANDG